MIKEGIIRAVVLVQNEA